MTWHLTWTGIVQPDWLDDLGHVNFLKYQAVADEGSLAFWKQANGGHDFHDRGGQEFVMAETHVRYLDELHVGNSVEVSTALLGWDEKRFQLLHRVIGDGQVSATVETVNLAFDISIRKVIAFRSQVTAFLSSIGAHRPT